MGQLLTHGDDGGFFHCVICGGDAAGPCARCRRPVCGDCCVLTEGTAGKWAICTRCDRHGGRRTHRAWWPVAIWCGLPVLALVILLMLLNLIFGPQ